MDKRVVWFETLYDTYADAIWKHLYYRLGDRERANELMQEVFMKTWQYIVLDKPIVHEKAFLYRIATNLYINEIRTDRQMTSLESLEEAGFDAVDLATDASIQAHQHELMERLAMIKESYKTVLVLRYIDELPVKEIAALLGERETNISMRIKRGLEALKRAYEQPQPSPSL